MEPTSEAHASEAVDVTLLGGFSIHTGKGSLTDENDRSVKLWSVLAYLLLHRERAVPQSEFIELFWPEDDSANPANALKTLLYRIRAMLEPLFGRGEQPILSRRGAYIWNPAIPCRLDIDRFSRACARAEDQALPRRERLDLYRQAVSLYRGDLLPKLNHQLWLVSLSAHYHSLYLAAVKDMAGLLEEERLYGEMYDVCARASELDSLDEGLHTRIVRALLRQGKDAAALDHYEKATDLLYRDLGVRPSEELRALYTEIMAADQSLETDLGAIMADLRETAARPGAFVCEYGFFREAYRLEARRALRRLRERGELAELAPGRYVHRAAAAAAERALRDAFGAAPFRLAQARDTLGLSRGDTLLLLELWDSTGVTRREGDARRFT